MGIKDFAVLRNAMEQINKKEVPNFSTLLIDGSNLIIMILMRHVSALFKNFDTFPFGGSTLNLSQQVNYLVLSAVKDIEEFVQRVKRYYKTLKQIYIVFDPLETPKYFIKMCWDYVDVLYPEESKDENKVILDDFKLNEQNKRTSGQTYEEFKQQNEEALNNFLESEEITDTELISILKELREQSNFFRYNRNALKLGKRVINELTKIHFENEDNILLVRGKYEADLVIKNIAFELGKDENILIASRDADYYFLFSDFDNVFCIDIIDITDAHHPNTIFKNLLGEAYSYNAVCRVSALLGNDYTAHTKAIINCKKYENIPKLFNVNNSLYTISAKDRNLYTLIKNSSFEKILTVDNIDELVLNYDIEYFKLYWKSIIVYTHWDLYNEYDILEFVKETKFPLPFEHIVLFNADYYNEHKWEEVKKSTFMPVEDEEVSYESISDVSSSNVLANFADDE